MTPDNPASARPRTWPFLAMIGSNVMLAFGPVLVRMADIGPVAAGFWRLALAVPLLMLLAWWPRGRTGAPAATHVPLLLPMLLLGGLFFAADLASWHVGILHTRLANATLFGNAAAFFFPLYGFAMARAWPGRVQGIAFVLAAAGMVLLLGRSYELSGETLQGDLLCLLAGLFYTVYLIAMERGRAALGAMPTLALSTLAGVVPLLLAAILLGERVMPGAWTPLVLLALGSQVIGQGLLIYAIGHLSPLVVGLGFLLQPVVSAGIGRLVYDERLTTPDLVGMALIAVALVLVRVRR